jgi:hypothetical protein
MNPMIKSLTPLPEMVMKRDRAFQDKFRRAALMMVVSADRYHYRGRSNYGLAFESGAIIGILQCTVARSKYQRFTPPWFDVVRALFDYALELVDAFPVDKTPA